MLSGGLERLEGPDGEELHDVPGGPRPDPGIPAPPRLMAMWDSALLAHADRGRILPDAYRPLVIRRNGDVLPALLVGRRLIRKAPRRAPLPDSDSGQRPV